MWTLFLLFFSPPSALTEGHVCGLVSPDKLQQQLSSQVQRKHALNDYQLTQIENLMVIYQFSGDPTAWHYDGSDGDAFDITHRQELAQQFYQSNGDVFDFIVILSDFDYVDRPRLAFYVGISNQVSGIGRDLFDLSDAFGSEGRLKGIVELGNYQKYLIGESIDQELLSHVLLHEIGHTWLASATYQEDGVTHHDLLDSEGLHWSFNLHSQGSHMYGNDWRLVAPNQYRAGLARFRYSDLDLYLMGMRSAQDVAPLTLLTQTEYPANTLPIEGAYSNAIPKEIEMSQLQAAMGLRSPAYSGEAQSFRVGVIFLHQGSDPIPQPFPEAVQQSLKKTAERFQYQTNGLGHLDFRSASRINQLTEPDVQAAIQFLNSEEQNLWQDHPVSRVRDSAATIRALSLHGEDVSAQLNTLAAWEDRHLDDTARIARLLAQHNLDATTRMQALLAAQQLSGGFALTSEHEASVLDTALALDALNLTAGSNIETARQNAINFLISVQSDDGSWGSSSFETAMAMGALARSPGDLSLELTEAINRAFTWLLTWQGQHGGLGKTDIDVITTSHVLMALLAVDQNNSLALGFLRNAQRLDGSWQGLIQPTALALQVLALQPDNASTDLVLRPFDVTFNTQEWSPGTIVEINARVQNRGQEAASNVSLSIAYENQSGRTAIATLDRGSDLAPGATWDINTTWTVPNDLFQFELQLEALTSTADSDPTNNRVRFPFFPNQIAPDLAILSEQTLVNQVQPFTGETIAVQTVIANVGRQQATDVRLQLYEGTPAEGRLLQEEPLADLLGSAQRAGQLSWTVDLAPGDHLITLLVIADEDTHLENNQWRRTLQVQEQIVGDDLGIDTFATILTPQAFQTIPQTFQVEGAVLDYGQTQPANTVIRLYRGPPASGELLAEQPITIAAYATPFSLSGNVQYLSDTELTLQVVSTGITDVRPNNNQQALFVPGNTLEDVEVVSESMQATNLIIGQEATLSVRVINRQYRALTNVVVLWEADRGEGFQTIAQAETNLSGAGETTVTAPWLISEPPGPVTLRLRLDPQNLLDELDENDNTLEEAFTIEQDTEPNIVLNSEALQLGTPPYQEGEALDVQVEVANNGGADATNVVVSLFFDDPTDTAVVSASPIALVAANTSQSVSLQINPLSVRGDHVLFAVATSDSESRTDDNQAALPIYIAGGPNPTFDPNPISLQPSWPAEGDAVTLTAKVRNEGAQVAENLLIELRQNAPDGAILDDQRLNLSPGSQDVTFNFVASSGIEALYVILDSQNEMVEQVETDNTAFLGFTLREGDFATDEPLISPNGDGVKDQATLFWDRDESELLLTITDGFGLPAITWTALPSSGSVVWNGRKQDGSLCNDGLYVAQLRDASNDLLLKELSLTIDNNRLKIRDALSNPEPGLVNQLSSDLNVGDQWIGWAKDSSRAISVMPSGPPVLVTPDGSSAESMSLYARETWTLAGTPGRYMFQGDTNFDDPSTYYLVLPDGSIDTTFTVDYWSGEQVLDWIAPTVVLVQTQSDPQLVRYDFASDTRSSINNALGAWHEVMDAFRWEDFVYILHLGIESSAPTGIYKVSLAGGEATMYRELGDTFLETPPATISRSNQFWTIVAREYVGAQAQDALFIDLEKEQFVSWEDLHPGTTPDVEGFYSDGRLYTHPREDVPPGSVLISDWVSGALYFVDQATSELLKGMIAPDDVRVLSYGPTFDLGIFSPQQNLGVVFEAILTGNGGVQLRGTATDKYLLDWQIEYASILDPESWQPTGLNGSFGVVNSIFGYWVPEDSGAYVLRLTARDKAGNARERFALATIEGSRPFYGVTLDNRLFSPNRDAVLESITLKFQAREPFLAEVLIYNSNGEPVKRLSQTIVAAGPASLTWDGSGESGAIVSDGSYTLDFDGLLFNVEVDATRPTLQFDVDDTYRWLPQATAFTGSLAPKYDQWFNDVHYQATDANLDYWLLERSVDDGNTWTEVARDVVSFVSLDLNPPRFNTRDHVLNQRFRLSAFDRAGNAATLQTSPDLSAGIWLALTRDQLKSTAYQDRMGSDLTVTNVLSEPVREIALRQLDKQYWFAVLPNSAFPLTLEQVVVRRENQSEPLFFEPIATCSLFPGPEIQPELSEDNLPAGTLDLQLQFRDAQGTTHLTEVVRRHDVQLQVDLEDVVPLANGNTRLTYRILQRLGGVSQQSRLNIRARFMGIQGGITFDAPSLIDAEGWRSSSEACKEYFQQRVRVEISAETYQSNEPLDGLFLFEDVTLGELELGNLESTQFCSGNGSFDLFPQFDGCTADSIQYLPRWEGTIPDALWQIQFFADSAGTRPITAPLNLEALASSDAFLVFPKAAFDAVAEPDLFARVWHPERNGSIQRVGQNGLGLAFELDFDRAAGITLVANLPLQAEPLDAFIPDQTLCTVPQDLQSDPDVSRDFQLQFSRSPAAQYGAINGLEFAPLQTLVAYPNGDRTVPIRLQLHSEFTHVGLGEIHFHTRALYRSGFATDRWLFEATLINEAGQCETTEGWISFSDHVDDGVVDVRIDAQNAQARFLASPNGDRIDDEAVVPLQLSQEISVTVWVETQAGVPIRLLRDGQTLRAGRHMLRWNGANHQDQTVADGIYRMRIQARTFCGEIIERTQTITLDSELPVIQLDRPLAGDVTLPQEVVLSASDARGLGEILIEMAPTVDLTESIVLYSRQSSGAPLPTLDQAAIAWLQARQAGEHMLTVIVKDRVGNTAEINRTLNVTPAALLEALALSSSWISPNNDGRFDQLQINYTLKRNATVQIRIQGTGVDRTLFNTERNAGQQTFTFNGQVDGSPLADGGYTLEITANDPEGVDSVQASLIVDRTAPTLALTQPSEALITNLESLTVEGSIQLSGGTDLAWWKLWQTGPAQPRTLLAEGVDLPDQPTLGQTLADQDGTFTLELEAQDAAGNQNALIRTYVQDTKAPSLQWERPQAREVFSASEPIALEGSYYEANPSTLRIERLTDEGPITLESWTTGQIQGEAFATQLDPSGLPDGWYTVRATMTDRVGLTSDVEQAFGLDNEPPIVALGSLPNGGIISAATPIVGTATDFSLVSYDLAIAYLGPRKRNEGFVPIFRGTQSVNDNVLHTWRVLPPDGQYRLRLTATDALGRTNQVERQIYVDRTAPEAPASLTLDVRNKGVAPNRYADVTLTWSPSTSDDVNGYRIHRNGLLVDTIDGETHQYIDTFVEDGHYLYEVYAVDLAGNFSEASAQAETLIDSTAPAPFIFNPQANRQLGGLIKINASIYDVRLASWTLSIGSGSEPVAWTTLKTGTENVPFDTIYQWLASAVDPGWYTLRLRASDTFGNVNEHRVSFEVVNQVPSRPDAPTATAQSYGIRVSWSPHPDGNIQLYRLFRDGVLLGTSQFPNVTDDAPDGTYSYQITAINYFGLESPLSPASTPVTLDRNAPTVAWLSPAAESRFETSLNLDVFSPDQDIASVQFEFREENEVTWTPIVNDAQRPWQTLWTPAIDDGTYVVRAVATEANSGDVDASPPEIRVHKGDTTPPEAPVLDDITQDEDRITFTWQAIADADSYRLYINDALVQTIAAPTVSYEHSGLSAGTYTATLTAVDAAGNASLPSNRRTWSLAAPVLEQTRLLTLDGAVQLSGHVPEHYTSVTVTLGMVEWGVLAVDGNGAFSDTLTMNTIGTGNLTLHGNHVSGFRSLPATATVHYPAPQQAPTDFTVVSDGLTPESAVLDWQAPLPTPEGYWVQRDGAFLNDLENLAPVSIQTTPTSDQPEWLMDENLQTAWTPASPGEQRVVITLAEIQAISELQIQWDEQQAIPEYLVIEAEQDGEWYRLHEFTPGNVAIWNQVFDGPLVTDTLHLVFPTGDFGIRDMHLQHRPFNTRNATSFTDTNPGNGVFAYALTAIGTFGRTVTVGPRSLVIGDPEPPAAPTNLAGQVLGNDASLAWDASPSDDVVAYRVMRDQRWLADTPNLVWVDADLLSGRFSYQVFALDAAGNLSSGSNIVTLDIDGEQPPQLTATANPDGSVFLDWQYAGDRTAFLGYRLERSNDQGVSWSQRYPSSGLTWQESFHDTFFPDLSEEIRYRVALVDLEDRAFYSNQVTLDAPVAQPKALLPAPTGTHLTIHRDSVSLAGQAQAGSQVQVRLNDGRTWQLPAQSFDQVTTLLEIDQEPLQLDLSSDGRYLVGSHRLQRGWWLFDTQSETPETLNTIQRARNLTIDPSGKWVAYVDRAEDSGGFLILLNLATLEAIVPDPATSVTGPLYWQSAGMLLYAAEDQLKAYDLYEDAVTERATLPQNITFVTSQNEHVYAATNQAFYHINSSNMLTEMGTQLGEGSHFYHRPSHQLFHIHHSTGEIQKVGITENHRLQLSGYVPVTTLPTDTHFLGMSATAGQVYVEANDGTVLQVAASETDSIAFAFPLEERFYATRQLANGTLLGAYYDDGAFQVQRFAPEGFFELEIEDLIPGLHRLAMTSVDPKLQRRSTQTPAITLNHAVTYYPNLVVEQSDLAAIPAAVVVGSPMNLRANIYNLGGGPASNIDITWRIYNAQDQLLQTQQQPMANLEANGFESLGFDFDTSGLQPGLYRFEVTLAAHGLPERDLTDNSASQTFVLVSSEGLNLEIELDQNPLQPGDDVSGAWYLTNVGPALQDLTLSMTLETLAGRQLEQQSLEIPILGNAATTQAPLLWSLQNRLAGTYRIRCEVLGGDGSNLAEQAITFTYVEERRVSLEWRQLAESWEAGNPLAAQLHFSNRSRNLKYASLMWRVQLIDGLDQIVGDLHGPWVALLPGASRTQAIQLPTADLTAGTYRMQTTVTKDDGTLVAQQTRNLEVTVTPHYEVLASLYVSPRNNSAGIPYLATAALNNTGNQLVDLTAWFTLVTSEGQEPQSTRWDVTLAPGESATHEALFETEALDNGDYTLRFHTDSHPQIDILETKAVSLTRDLPPVVTLDGVPEFGHATEPLRIFVTVEDEDDPAPTPALTLNGEPYVSGALIDVEGTYQLIYFVEDSAGNISQDRVEFAYDATPPQVTVPNVPDQGSVDVGIVPEIQVADIHRVHTNVYLDGEPIQPGFDAVATPGPHELYIQAFDAYQLRTDVTLTFVADDPLEDLISLVGSADDGAYRQARTISVNLADGATLLHFRVDGQDVVAPVTLSEEGVYQVQALAQRGSRTQEANLTFEIDQTAPQIVIEGVAANAHYGEAVRPTILIDGQQPDAATTVTLNGSPYTPGTAIDAEQTHTLRVVGTDAAGNQSTQSVTFTVDTTAPQIQVDGVSNGETYSEPVTITWQISDDWLAEVQATLNDVAVDMPLVIDETGDYTLELMATDEAGNQTTVTTVFTYEGQHPLIVISGVAADAVVQGPVLPVIDVSGVEPLQTTILLNGASWEGHPITDEGIYTLEVQVTAGNQLEATAERSFTIDRTGPSIVISGVENEGTYRDAVTPIVEIHDPHLVSSEMTLNGIPFISGTQVSDFDDYVLNVTALDLAGNQSQVTLAFRITEVAPLAIVVTGVEADQHYATGVIPTIDIQGYPIESSTIMLNGQPFQSGTPVNVEGEYLLEVQARNADESVSTSVAFVLDFTAPDIQITGVSEGDVLTQAVVPNIQVTDAHLTDEALLLNDAAYTRGQAIGVTGSYTLVVRAQDRAGNQARETIHFELNLPHALTLTPNPLLFQSQTTQTVTVHNTANRSVRVFFANSSHPQAFSLVGTSDLQVPVNGSATFQIRFQGETNLAYRETLTFLTDLDDQPQLLLDVIAAPEGQDLLVSSQRLYVPPLQVGRSKTLTLTLNHLGEGQLPATFEVEGASFAFAETLPNNLAPESTLDLAITFTPQNVGSHHGFLRVMSDSQTVQVPLHGVGMVLGPKTVQPLETVLRPVSLSAFQGELYVHDGHQIAALTQRGLVQHETMGEIQQLREVWPSEQGTFLSGQPFGLAYMDQMGDWLPLHASAPRAASIIPQSGTLVAITGDQQLTVFTPDQPPRTQTVEGVGSLKKVAVRDTDRWFLLTEDGVYLYAVASQSLTLWADDDAVSDTTVMIYADDQLWLAEPHQVVSYQAPQTPQVVFTSSKTMVSLAHTGDHLYALFEDSPYPQEIVTHSGPEWTAFVPAIQVATAYGETVYGISREHDELYLFDEDHPQGSPQLRHSRLSDVTAMTWMSEEAKRLDQTPFMRLALIMTNGDLYTWTPGDDAMQLMVRSEMANATSVWWQHNLLHVLAGRTYTVRNARGAVVATHQLAQTMTHGTTLPNGETYLLSQTSQLFRFDAANGSTPLQLPMEPDHIGRFQDNLLLSQEGALYRWTNEGLTRWLDEGPLFKGALLDGDTSLWFLDHARHQIRRINNLNQQIDRWEQPVSPYIHVPRQDIREIIQAVEAAAQTSNEVNP